MSSERKQYPFRLIEPKWQRIWEDQQVFRAWNPGETIPENHPFRMRHGAASATDRGTLPPKCYILDMFPYPSGAGLHVGHPEGYTATDILARYRRALGYNVLHPMGWDAFGLPAEQYAIKTGQHPRKTTEQNIATFKRQIQSLGFSYDWSREIDTTDPKYFRWTQWIFLRLYGSWFNPETKRAERIESLPYPPECVTEEDRRIYRDSRRLAYVAEAPVNWCPELGTVLANEEVINGKSEVGDFPVVRKPMRQWMLRITAYAERLLDDLALIDWSHSLKEMQRNWIGRSEGAEVRFRLCNLDGEVAVFTTRPDTLFGATYMVLAPEHPLVDRIVAAGWPQETPEGWKGANATAAGDPKSAIESYRVFAASKSDLERTELSRDKTGVFTGAFAVNPVNGEGIPIWIADYVLATYGTGAIMAVPGHDTRDLEFARKFGLPIVQVVEAPNGQESIGFVGDGVSINSGFISGLQTLEAKRTITEWLEGRGDGRRTVNYKLRDWLFSRQRYWGEPFPLAWRNGGHEALLESELPILPPSMTDYKPTSSGEPPLARAVEWVKLADGALRETNTMPQWAGSCWYYLRYLDPRNESSFCGKEAEQYWMGTDSGKNGEPNTNRISARGVDLYVGGTEHAVLHLLYSRFWHKILFDLGFVSTPEPFYKLVNQGLILGEDGQKMSKSRGNTVNPDDVINEYGADAFRLYEMFLGPLEMVKPWNTKGVEGVYRFLGRTWRLFVNEKSETEFEQTMTTEFHRGEDLLHAIELNPAIQDVAADTGQLKTLHATIKKVTEDLDGLRFNTAISALMVFVNEAMGWTVKPVSALREFLVLLQPFAPHLAEELFRKLASVYPAALGVTGTAGVSLAYEPWPRFDPAFLIEATIELPVQVNGKLRDRIVVPADATQSQIEEAAKSAERVKLFLDGKTIKKIIVVPRKTVNIVAV
ncbi:MAG: leucine--tRNA ligase [Verrucomicrobia bacterium]|nr:leucine--tRNA ligase [Verrucomicrobiota bacterium]